MSSLVEVLQASLTSAREFLNESTFLVCHLLGSGAGLEEWASKVRWGQVERVHVLGAVYHYRLLQ